MVMISTVSTVHVQGASRRRRAGLPEVYSPTVSRQACPGHREVRSLDLPSAHKRAREVYAKRR